MAGLLKPQAAYNLVSALKDAVTVPIHLHSHEAFWQYDLFLWTCCRC